MPRPLVSSPLGCFVDESVDYFSGIRRLIGLTSGPVTIYTAYVSYFATKHVFPMIPQDRQIHLVCNARSECTDLQDLLLYAKERGNMDVRHFDNIHSKLIYSDDYMILGSANLSESALTSTSPYSSLEHGVWLSPGDLTCDGQKPMMYRHLLSNDTQGSGLSIFNLAQEVDDALTADWCNARARANQRRYRDKPLRYLDRDQYRSILSHNPAAGNPAVICRLMMSHAFSSLGLTDVAVLDASMVEGADFGKEQRILRSLLPDPNVLLVLRSLGGRSLIGGVFVPYLPFEHLEHDSSHYYLERSTFFEEWGLSTYLEECFERIHPSEIVSIRHLFV